MALPLELLMALAKLGSLDGPSLEASHGPLLCLGAWMALRWEFSWPLLCLRAWMSLRWELLLALAMLGSLDDLRWKLLMDLVILGSLDGPSLEASHGPCYAWELGRLFVGSFSWH